jgi:Tc5 transposase DNA-binding domain
MDHEARIQAAITDLQSQERVNYSATAKRYNLERTTLAKRFQGKTVSNQEATSYARRQLTDTQEKTLIQYINKLSNRGIPPTPQIVKNLAVEIAGDKLGPNWVSRFCKRHQKDLKSVYLRTIDHKRKVADNSAYFQHFYEQVRLLFIAILYTFHMDLLLITIPLFSFTKRLKSTVSQHPTSTTLMRKAS